MDVILVPAVKLVVTIIDIYIWIVVIGILLNWLVALNVINTSNRFVYMVGDFIFRVTEPILSKIRNIVPIMGNFDLSPVVLVLGLVLIKDVLINLAMRLVG